MTDALSGLAAPANAEVGDLIAHFALPDFAMTVLDVSPCEQSGTRSEPHNSYLVTDPEGEPDFLCAWDVTVVRDGV